MSIIPSQPSTSLIWIHIQVSSRISLLNPLPNWFRSQTLASTLKQFSSTIPTAPTCKTATKPIFTERTITRSSEQWSDSPEHLMNRSTSAWLFDSLGDLFFFSSYFYILFTAENREKRMGLFLLWLPQFLPLSRSLPFDVGNPIDRFGARRGEKQKKKKRKTF